MDGRNVGGQGLGKAGTLPPPQPLRRGRRRGGSLLYSYEILIGRVDRI